MYNDPISNYQFETGLTNGHDDDLSPEHCLWRVVILLFLQDIQKDYLVYTNSLNGRRGKAFDEIQKHRHVANSEWLKIVCDFGMLDYDRFLEVVENVLAGKQEILINAQFRV